MWRTVPSFPSYMCNENGDIKSDYTGKILKNQILERDGYKQVNVILFKDKKRHQKTLARIILETFSPDKFYRIKHAAHKDGNSVNNALSNLYWATPKENMDDQRRHKTLKAYRFGYTSKKVPISKVRHAIVLKKLGWSWSEIEKEVGIPNSSIRTAATANHLCWRGRS